MTRYENPFEFDAASNLSDELIVDFYIEDYNYSRFIESKRNVFLVGQRGSGKTMALLYNSHRVKNLRLKQGGQANSYDKVGVYVPCNTPLIHKEEHKLLEPFQASVVSEHYLVLSLMYGIADAFTDDERLIAEADEYKLCEKLEVAIDIDLPKNVSFFDGVKLFVNREGRRTQRRINAPESDAFYEDAYTFSTAVLPLINLIGSLPSLKKSHFLFMIDDAQDLNYFQRRTLNSWVSYRDHSRFSFKVALAKVGKAYYITNTGGAILEGHDFVRIDMEHPYQNEQSDFGRLAHKIIAKRLTRVGIKVSPEEFFPINQNFKDALQECKNRVQERAESMYRGAKQRQDYVYKYSRVEYFRSRSDKANLIPYSGFDIIVHLSTGVIRNLLEPCFFMYDAHFSSLEENETIADHMRQIPPTTQTSVILRRSERLWERVEKELDTTVENCSREDARLIFNLFDNLAQLFRDRLLHHDSEPRAISFSISAPDEHIMKKLMPLLDIARDAQILYTRSGPAKDSGRRETYFVPNRMLWPARGLDPHGQHARVSIKADALWAAAHNKQIKRDDSNEDLQGGLDLEYE